MVASPASSWIPCEACSLGVPALSLLKQAGLVRLRQLPFSRALVLHQALKRRHPPQLHSRLLGQRAVLHKCFLSRLHRLAGKTRCRLPLRLQVCMLAMAAFSRPCCLRLSRLTGADPLCPHHHLAIPQALRDGQYPNDKADDLE